MQILIQTVHTEQHQIVAGVDQPYIQAILWLDLNWNCTWIFLDLLNMFSITVKSLYLKKKFFFKLASFSLWLANSGVHYRPQSDSAYKSRDRDLNIKHLQVCYIIQEETQHCHSIQGETYLKNSFQSFVFIFINTYPYKRSLDKCVLVLWIQSACRCMSTQLQGNSALLSVVVIYCRYYSTCRCVLYGKL